MKLPCNNCLQDLVKYIDNLYLSTEDIYCTDVKKKKGEYIVKNTILHLRDPKDVPHMPKDNYYEYFAYGAKNVPAGYFPIYNLTGCKTLRLLTKDEKYTIVMKFTQYTIKRSRRMETMIKKLWDM